MALGDGGNYGNTDSNKKKNYSPEVYSAYNTSNENGVDPSALSYSFWSGALKISIAPMLKNPTERQKWDHENSATVFLTHRSARILREGALKVLKGECTNAGTRSGVEGLVMFTDGKEVGSEGPCLIIRKVNQNNGEIMGTYVYEFNRDRHFGVENFQADTSDFDKVYYDNIEVDEFLEILEQYYKAMTKAYAAAVIDEEKYNHSRINTKLELIAEALGVEFKSASGSSRTSRGGSSYFDKSSGSSSGNSEKRNVSRQTSLDELGGMMPDDPE